MESSEKFETHPTDGQRQFGQAVFPDIHSIVDAAFGIEAAGTNDADAYLQIANRMIELGLLGEADKMLSHTVGRFPDSVWSGIKYGEVAKLRGNWREMLARLRLVQSRVPEHEVLQASISEALVQLGEFTAADKEISRAAELSTEFWVSLRWAEISWLQADLPTYLSRLQILQGKFPGDERPIVSRIEALFKIGAPAEAYKLAIHHCGSFPNNEMLALRAVEGLIVAGEIEKAYQIYDRVHPSSSEMSSISADIAWAIFCDQPDHSRSDDLIRLLANERDSGERTWAPRLAYFLFRTSSDERSQHVKMRILETVTKLIPSAGNELSRLVVLTRFGQPLSDDQMYKLLSLTVSGARTPLMTLLFSHILSEIPGRRDQILRILRRFIADTMEQHDKVTEMKPELLLGLLMFCSIYSDNMFSTVVENAYKGLISSTYAPNMATAAGAVESILTHQPSAPATISNVKIGKLRIALCVSGQLRGYRDAFPTWGKLGLGAHHTRTFVHTWRKIGRMPPIRYFEFRSFRGRFLKAYQVALAEKGFEALRIAYPKLIEAASASGLAGEAELKQFYSADKVVVDDDESGIFRGKRNTWKMGHKIRKAHESALSAGEFDLVIRFRPDREITSAEDVDWNKIEHICRNERMIFDDWGRTFHDNAGYAVADQFAVSTPEIMNIYADAFRAADDAESGGFEAFDFPNGAQPHTTLAYWTLYNGVKVKSMPGVVFGSLLNPGVLSPSMVVELLTDDIGSQMRDARDEYLLAAANSDLA